MTIAALILPFALLQAADTGPVLHSSDRGGARFERCVAQIEGNAAGAYEEGMAWAAEGQALGGYRCAAMALIAQNRVEEGARRLESLATAVNPNDPGLRAELFAQAGNAWLLNRDAGHARSAFTRALVGMEASPQKADLLIDRARAYAMERDYRQAEEDLSSALDSRPNDALALRLRASARMHQNAFELAEADALAATRIEPSNVDNYLILGHVRESARTGTPVEEQ